MRPWKKTESNGRTWSIYIVKDLATKIDYKPAEELAEDEIYVLHGVMFPTTRSIMIDSRSADDVEEFWDTLIHEMLHAVEDSEELKQSSEAHIRKLARGLAQMLKPFLKKPRTRSQK